MTDDDRSLLRRLLDIEEIKALKARYFRTLDQRDWAGFGRVFAVDAVLEVPEADMVERGREAIVAAVSGALTGARTVHHGHMPEIEITGADTATGTWAMFDYVEWPAAGDARRRSHRVRALRGGVRAHRRRLVHRPHDAAAPPRRPPDLTGDVAAR